MRKGDIVKIYQDPITKRDIDGEARLVQRIPYYGDERLEQWELVFIEDGMRTTRLIAKNNLAKAGGETMNPKFITELIRSSNHNLRLDKAWAIWLLEFDCHAIHDNELAYVSTWRNFVPSGYNRRERN